MEDFLQQGIVRARQKDYQTAIDLFTEAISHNSLAAEAYYRRGLAYYNLAQIERAIADYDRSLDLDAKQVDVYLSRAIAFLDLDEIQSSIIDLQIVFSLDPNCDKAYRLRANICIRLKEYSAAIDYLKQAGKIYLERRDKESCRLCIARIRQIEQHTIAARGGISDRTFLQQIEQKLNKDKLDEAFIDCNWLLQLDPYNALAYQYRGEINIKFARYERAKQDLRQAAKYFRTQGNTAESERLERRCLELQLEDIYQHSSKNITRLVRTSYPQNAIQDRLYTLVGDWNIAQSLVERLMQLHPDRPENWYWSKAIDDIERDRF